jgi:hypothetical protein
VIDRAEIHEYIYRVKAARRAARLKPRDIARALDIRLKSYRRFEHSDLLPINHIATFCATVGCSPLYLLTGELLPVQLHIIVSNPPKAGEPGQRVLSEQPTEN